MTESARPSVDVRVTLDRSEWLELYRESLRGTGLALRVIWFAAGLALTGGLAVWLGAPAGPATSASIAALLGLATYLGGYLWLGPRRRWRRVDDPLRTAHWKVGGQRIATDHAGRRLDLTWPDVEQLVITKRLLVLRLADGGDVLGLPRRAATDLGEQLIAGWATQAGAELVRRRPRT